MGLVWASSPGGGKGKVTGSLGEDRGCRGEVLLLQLTSLLPLKGQQCWGDPHGHVPKMRERWRNAWAPTCFILDSVLPGGGDDGGLSFFICKVVSQGGGPSHPACCQVSPPAPQPQHRVSAARRGFSLIALLDWPSTGAGAAHTNKGGCGQAGGVGLHQNKIIKRGFGGIRPACHWGEAST